MLYLIFFYSYQKYLTKRNNLCNHLSLVRRSISKKLFKAGNFEGKLEKDFYGNVSKPFTPLNKKPITPKLEEIKLNPRARSAKLRIATKN